MTNFDFIFISLGEFLLWLKLREFVVDECIFLPFVRCLLHRKKKKTFYFCFSLTLSRMQRQPGVAKCSVVRPDKGKTVRFFDRSRCECVKVKVHFHWFLWQMNNRQTDERRKGWTDRRTYKTASRAAHQKYWLLWYTATTTTKWSLLFHATHQFSKWSAAR